MFVSFGLFSTVHHVRASKLPLIDSVTLGAAGWLDDFVPWKTIGRRQRAKSLPDDETSGDTVAETRWEWMTRRDYSAR